MRAQGIPQPPAACGPDNRSCDANSRELLLSAAASPDLGSLLHLAAPVGNSAYAIHPGVPVERQRIAVDGYTADGQRWSSLRLMVDGEPIVSAVDATELDGWWMLTPGQHTFWLEGEMAADSPTIRSAEATIVVE
jgi:hypothetical protein